MKTVKLLTLIILALIQCSFARESKNCPTVAEAAEMVKSAGEKHSSIASIKERDSHKTSDSYLHIFYGKLDDDHCLLVFDNQKKYLGYYNTGAYVVAGYDSSNRMFWMFTNKDQRKFVRLGNRGPWKIMGFTDRLSPITTPVVVDTFTFNGTSDYVEPTAEPETRDWLYGKKKKPLKAKLMDGSNDWCYLQNSDGAVYYIPMDNLSSEDRKYVKSAVKQGI